MSNAILAHGGDTIGSYGTEWLYLLAPLLLGAGVITYLFRSGAGGGFLTRISSSLERITGLTAWSAGAIGMGLLALIVAVLGFYWDVAWHIELGRDEFIFTPAHMGILLGLMLIVVAGLTAVVLATSQRTDTRVRFRQLRIPLSAIPITLLGVGALSGFPLDELWHRNYGIDVTMWGPTHLLMITGASLTPIGLLLAYVEGRRGRELTQVGTALAPVLAGALVVGLSTWTGEFDFGVPQFQALYHPVLVMAGSAMALIASRHLLGPGGAIRAALGAIALRLVVALAIGAGLGHVIPRFPLYLGTALAVELGTRLTRNHSAARAALFTGALIATLGFASEWLWMGFWGRHAWTAALLPGVLIVPVGAIAATVLGWAMGRVMAGERAGMSTPVVATAGIALILILAAPLPRNDAPLQGVLETRAAGEGRVSVELTLEDEDLAGSANWFEVLSWQGGAMHVTNLEEVAPGHFRGEHTVPVTGEWKSMVRLASDDTMIATPVYLPADELIGASEVPVEPRREVEFQKDSDLLLREARQGAAWPAMVAYSTILFVAVVWIVTLSIAVARLQPADRPRRSRRSLRASEAHA